MNTASARLGHYDIVEELGRGGMGVVYKGYEASLGRYVAIKVLAAAMAHDPVFVERFLREARSMAALNDPHIIQIYFIGQDEEQTFFVMEFIDGESLSDWIKRDTRLSPSDSLKVLLDASRGLATAHAQGVIHRDIKPGNIMITSRGLVKVADFGIALASNDMTSSKLTNTGALVGTPGYLSPEVCLGKPVDQRSDIFALGIVLFEMLSGRMPFVAESPLKLMLDVVEAEIPDIRELNPGVDEETTRILARMLAKNPLERYQSCDELNADLQKHPLIISGGPLQVRSWSESDASKSTMIGAPSLVTRDTRPPRMATPPPQVSSRTQAPPAAHAPTLPSQALPAAPAPAKSKLLPIMAGAVVVLALAGWAFMRFGPGKQAEPVTASTALADATAPASGTQTPPVTNTTPGGQVATNSIPAGASGATADANSAAANPAANSNETAANAMPTADAVAASDEAARAAAELQAQNDRAAEVMARETTRRKRLAAAAAAIAARRDESTAASDDESDSSESSDDSEGGGERVTAAEARRRYLCRVQKKC